MIHVHRYCGSGCGQNTALLGFCGKCLSRIRVGVLLDLHEAKRGLVHGSAHNWNRMWLACSRALRGKEKQ